MPFEKQFEGKSFKRTRLTCLTYSKNRDTDSETTGRVRRRQETPKALLLEALVRSYPGTPTKKRLRASLYVNEIRRAATTRRPPSTASQYGRK